jgi:choline dehydrogenase-like flavoprotein
MRATSRGVIQLKSRDPRQHPIIDPNYLATGKNHLLCHWLKLPLPRLIFKKIALFAEM